MLSRKRTVQPTNLESQIGREYQVHLTQLLSVGDLQVMDSKFCALLLTCFLLAMSACQQPASPTSATPPTDASRMSNQLPADPAKERRTDACNLITPVEIETVQGEKIIEAKSSSQSTDTFIVNQCYYVAAENGKSVVLSVYRADAGNPAGRRPKDFWRERFAAVGSEKERDNKSKDKESEQAEKEESTPPQVIEGLGDQAYWLDNKLGGALYVLKGDEFFRVSLGGIPDTELRINKAKSLARGVLKRLESSSAAL